MQTAVSMKKYLLYLVGLLFVLIGVHLVLLYIYSDAKTDPIAWGIVRIGLLSPSWSPSIDPVEYDSRTGGTDFNDMITHFLYRGLLSYDTNQEKIVEDLTRCDIQDFPKFTCEINDHALWNDGEKVKVEDIVATYDFYKNFSKNIGLKSRLEKIQVEAIDETVRFTFATSDITILDVLFIPILRAQDIARFDEEGSFQQYSFSGPYIFKDRSTDAITWVDTITLQKNVTYIHKNVYINQVNLSFYATIEKLEKASKNLDVLFTGEDILPKTAMDWLMYGWYLRPQYFAAFLDYARLWDDERSFITKSILSRDATVVDFDLLPVRNVFMQPVTTEKGEEKEIDIIEIMQKSGYTSGVVHNQKQAELHIKQQEKQKDTNDAIVTESEQKKEEKKNTNVQELTYVQSPSDISPYITTSDEQEIVGTFPEGTATVSVNAYGLRLFNPSENIFKYRTSLIYQNIVEGKNTYNILFFNANGAQIGSETYEIWYTTSADTLAQYNADIAPDLTPEIPEAEVVTIPVTKEEIIPAPEQVDESYFYNDEGERFSFSVVYPVGSEVLSAYAENISKTAVQYGIELELIPASKEQIEDIASGQKREYDIFLTGVHTGIFDYNIFPSFHSGQAKSWLNFSGIRDTKLDGLLEQSRDGVYYSSPTQLIQLKQDILSVLDPLSIVYTIGSPYEHIYTRSDKIQGITIPKKLPSIELLSDILVGSYLQVSYRPSGEEKTLGGFVKWFFNSLINPAWSRI